MTSTEAVKTIGTIGLAVIIGMVIWSYLPVLPKA